MLRRDDVDLDQAWEHAATGIRGVVTEVGRESVYLQTSRGPASLPVKWLLEDWRLIP